MYAIEKSDMDLRKMLYQNIVLSGGSTLFKGFGDRLLSELRKHSAKDLKIRVRFDFFKKQTMQMLITFFNYNFTDCCSSGTALFNVDGRFYFSFARYFQENVDF